MLTKSTVRPTRSALTRMALTYAENPLAARLNEWKAFSMLHQETLLILNYLARESNGVVLEIGPYIGGSTVAIGEGLKAHTDPTHIVIDHGGAHDHPEMPSTDILRDLKARIAQYQLRGISLFEGWSTHAGPFVEAALAGRPIGLLMIDADGMPERDWKLFSPFFDKNTMIVLDDVLMDAATSNTKAVPRQWVADAIESGRVEDLGTYMWGTWVGRPLLSG